MKYACRGVSSDIPGPPINGPMFDDPPADEDTSCLLGPGGGDASALLPWVDGAGEEPKKKPDQGLKLDLKNKELRAGTPDDPNSGYFLASAKEQGARWRTSEGGFSGKIDKTGLDTRAVLGEHDQLHGTVDADKKSGALAWEHDGKNEGELYGRYGGGKDWEAGLRRTWGVGEGSLTTGLRHQVTAEGATDGIYGDYTSKDKSTTLHGDVGLRDGNVVGGLNGSHKFSDTRTITGSLAYDEKGTTAKLGGVYDNLSLDGNYAHTQDGDTYGLSGAYKLGDRGSLTGSYAHTKDNDTFKLGGNYKLGETDTINGSFSHDKDATIGKLGGEHTWKGGSLSGSVEVADRAKGTTTTLAGAYKDGPLSLDGSFAHAPDGNSLNLNGGYKFGEQGAVNGSFSHTPQKDALSLSGSYKPTDQWSLGGKLGYERNADGTQQGTLGLSEKFRSPNLVHGLDLDAGVGTRNFLSATGSIDGRLGNNLYAGAWGNATMEEGKRASGQLGGSLTYMANDKTALTAAGMVNDRGQMEARLELDLFKKGIENTPDLVDRRKDAPISLFLSYAQGGTRAMDNRYGAPQYGLENKDATISGGIRLRF